MAGILGSFVGGVTDTLAPAVQQGKAFIKGVRSAIPTISPAAAGVAGQAAGAAGVVDLAGRAVTAGVNNVLGPGDDAVEAAQKRMTEGTWQQFVPNWLHQAGVGAAIGAHALATGRSISDPIYSIGEPPDPATPAAPPTVVGQTPAAAPAAPATPAPGSTEALLAKTANTIANTPIDTVPSNKYDVVAAAAAKGAQQNSFTDFNTPGVTRAGAVQAPAATVPVAKPAAPTMNAGILEQQQNLMAQIAAAQQVVSAGSNRDGYKMGDVTKGIATMQALSPLVASTNNLLAANYGVDAGIINHTADNVARTNIANAANATEMAKTDLSGQYGVLGHEITAQANAQLAQQKAVLDAMSPAGQKALVEAQTAKRNFDDTAGIADGAARVRAVMGKAQDFQQVKDSLGVTRGRMVDGVYVPFTDAENNQITPPPKKK